MPVSLSSHFKSSAPGFCPSSSFTGKSDRSASRQTSLTLRPKTALILGGLLAITTICSVGSAAYWLLQDDMLDVAKTRQEVIETAYQDRIDRLRAEINRLNSRQALDRQSVEQQVTELMRQQQALQERHSIVSGLMQRAERSGIRLAISNPLPARKPDGFEAIDRLLADDDTSAIGGESEPLTDPLKALGLRGTSESTLPVTGEPVAATPGEQAALRQVGSDLDAMDRESTAALDALAVATETQIDTILTATSQLGINLKPAASGSARTGVGGPFVPYYGSGFSGRVKRAEHALKVLGGLKAAAKRLPVARPMKSVRISSNFGPRIDPFLGKIAMHTGMDFKAPYGARVYSAGPGTVIHAGRKGGYGKLVEIRHANGLVSRYAHLSRLHVSKGDHVTAGDVIGNVGSTGRSTGPHLHYEIRIGNEPLDPADFVTAGDKLSKVLEIQG